MRAAGIGVIGAVRGADATAPRLRRLLACEGPTFLKVGQLLSGGTGLFPDRFVEEFADFRDDLPPAPFAHVRSVLSAELPNGEAHFVELDEEPLAAASIAQVHRGVLQDGREVVVKVQRPGVAEQVQRELTWLATIARIIDRLPSARTANFPGIVDYFAHTLVEELDFRLEAENMLDVAEAVACCSMPDGVAVPRPHAELVTRRVLVMERLRGYSSADAVGIAAASIDTEAMLRAGFVAFFEGALSSGIFHGDLHPGNVLVLHDGRYGLVDFGIVGRLTTAERRAFATMMAAGAAGDLRGQVAGLWQLGGFPPDADLDAIAASFPSDLLGGEDGLPSFSTVARSMRAHLQVMVRHRFRLPRVLVLLSKNLIFADDSVRRFSPGLDLLTDALPILAAAASSTTAASGDEGAATPAAWFE
jgi:ubiquinone biosynthesis protein